MKNNEAYSDDGGSYRLRDIITGLLTVGPQVLLILLLLLGGARIRESLMGPSRATAAAVQEVVQPTAEAVVEVAQAEQATPAATPIPTPDVPETLPVIAPPSVDVAGALAPSELFLVPAGIAAGWVADQMPGIALDPNSPGGLSGLPPHLQALFQGADAAATGTSGFGIDPNKPQLNIIPLAALQGMYNEAGLDGAAASLDSLKDLLTNRPEGAVDIPYPPVFGGPPQGIQSDPTYIDFNGGSGVGYVTHFSFDAGPISNDNGLVYVFQGVTADGSQYVVGAFPLQADFLPDSLNDVPQETMNEIAANPIPYLESVVEQINTADEASISPAPAALAAMLSGMIIGGDAVAANEAAVATDLAAAPPMTNVAWQWTAFVDLDGSDNLKIDNPENYTLVLNADGTYNMKADCNVVNGSYSFAGGTTLTLNPGASTLAACGPDSFEATYRQYLIGQPLGYAFNADGNLILTLPDGSGELAFRDGGPAGPGPYGSVVIPPLVGTPWQWTAFQDLVGSDNLKIDDPTRYAFTLNADGTYNMTADCNSVNGTYTFEGGKTLTLNPGAGTRVFCGEGSFDSQFIDYLAQPLSYSFSPDGNLQLTLPDGSGKLGFINGAAGSEAPAPPMTNVLYQWVAFQDLVGSDNLKIDNPENYTLALNADGTYNLKADCNSVVGSYSFAGGTTLTLNPGASTLVACGPDSLDSQYLGYLAQPLSYSFSPDGNLQLTLPDGSGQLAFADAGPAGPGPYGTVVIPPLEGTTWQWTAFQDLVGSDNLKIDDPERYSLTLNGDGTYTMLADCNTVNGTYTFEGGKTLTLSPGASTKMMCPEGSFDAQFVEYFAQPLGYSFSPDGNLQLTLPDGSGKLGFIDGSDAAAGQVDPMVNVLYQWASFEDLDGSDNLKIDNPENYTFALNPDGTYTIKADCNIINGTYGFENGKLVLQPGASTKADCGPDSFSDQYLSYFAEPLDYSFDVDGNLQLNLPDGSGELAFIDAGPAGPGPSGSVVVPSLEGSTFQWGAFVDLDGSDNIKVDNPEDYTVTLNPDGTYTIKADCNTVVGAYTFENGLLNLQPGASTLAACGPDSLDAQFLDLVFQPLAYSFSPDANLVLSLPDGSGELSMSTDAAAGQVDPMVNVLYQWASFEDLDGSDNLKIDDPENYTFALNPDGTYTIKADCNIINGTYGFENGKLVLQPGASTLAACGPDSFSDQYLSYFAEPLDYSFDVDGNLQLNLPDGSGELAFIDAGPAGPGPSGSVVVPSLEGSTFQWGAFVDLDGSDNIKVDNPEDYTVTLNPDGTYTIKADCNTVVGAYTFENGLLNLQPGASTLAACGPDSLDAQFLDLVFQPLAYSFSPDANLVLSLPDGSGELSMSTDAAGRDSGASATGGAESTTATGGATQTTPSGTSQPAPAIAGTSWQWVSFVDAKQSFSLADPTLYTITFNADGSVAAKLDCNSGTGTWTATGSSLMIDVRATTRVACAEGSLGNAFATRLNAAAIFVVEGTVLRIDLFADSGTMTFSQIQ